MPPLKDRVQDIPLLVRFLVDKFAARIGRRIDHVSVQTMDRLKAYSWPGNVRELENVTERAIILASTETLEIESEMLPNMTSDGDVANRSATLEDLERKHILAVLNQTRWVIDGDRGAARILGLHPNTLRSRMKKLGVSRPHDQS